MTCKSLIQEYGPLIPNIQVHEAGKYKTQKLGKIMTVVPVQKAPIHTMSGMKP